jgi:putative peptidoglycan lipid II flippase
VRVARRLLLGGTAAVAALGAGAALAPAAAAARSPTPATPAITTASVVAPLVVTVTAVGPTALAPGTTLTVRGTVRNTTGQPVRSVAVALRAHGPLTTRDQVAAWRDAGPLDDRGSVLESERISDPVAAGAVVPFSFTVPASHLLLDPSVGTPQAVGLAVSADGGTDGTGADRAVVRTFTVWQPRPVTQPIRLSVLVPVTQPVARTDVGASGAHSPSDWSTQGRLSRVLRATADTRVSWVVDPALLSSAAPVAPSTPPPSGSPSSSPAASASPSASSAAAVPGPASSWLQAFTASARHRDVSVLPWGDPDVVALARGNAGELLGEAEKTASSVFTRLLQRAPATTVTLPEGGRADGTTVRNLARSGRAVVLDSGALRSALPLPGGRADVSVTVRRQATVAKAIVSDQALSADIAASGPGALPTQNLLADLAVTAAEDPGRSVLATTPRSWNPDPAPAQRTFAALRSAPWVTLRPYSELAGDGGGEQALPVTFPYSAAERSSELPPEHVSAVVAADHGLAGFAPSLIDAAPVTRLQAQAFSLVGLGWRRHDTTALALARTSLTSDVDGLYAGLSVDPGSTKNLLAKEGLLPITVSNSLPYRVKVMLVLTPLSGQLSVKEARIVTLEPTSSRQVFMPIRAVANGDVEVVASFRTPDGSAVLYQSPRIQVRVRSDWETRGLGVVAVALGLLLFVGLARGVRRGRARTRIPPESVPDPDDVGRVPVPDGTEDRAEDDAEQAAAPPTETPVQTGVQPGAETAPGEVRSQADARPAEALHGRGRHARRAMPEPADTAHLGPLPVAVETVAGAASDQAQEASEPAGLTSPVVDRSPTTLAASNGARNTSATATIPRADPTGLAVAAPAAPTSASGPAPAPDAEPAPTEQPLPVPGGTTMAGPAVNDDEAAGAGGGTDGGGAGGGGAPAADESGSTARLMSSSAVMAAGTLLSRLLGMVRVVVLAWAVGAAFSANAFATANTLPNSLFLLIGGGVLNAVLVPQIVAAMERPDGGREYVDRLLTLSLAVLAVATLVVTAMAPLLLRLFGSPTWSTAEVGVGVAFAIWCLPQVFFYGLYTVLGQVLNARGSFGPYMWAPVVNNVVAIAGMLVFVALYGSGDHPAGWWTPAAIAVLAGTTTLGVMAQALILVPVLRRTGFRWRPRRGFRGVGLRRAGSVAGWTFAALLVGQLGLVLVSRIANEAGQQAGDVGTGRFVYDTAFLLFMLPHSIVAVSVVTAVFTRVSHAVVTDRLDAVRADVSVALRTIGVATVLATVAFAVLGQDLTTLLFATNSRSTAQGLAWTMTAMMIGLVPFSAIYLFQRVFYAFGDARTPFWVQVVVIAVWSAGNLLAAARLQGVPVVVGIGVAMSVANLVGALVLGVLTSRRIHGIDTMRVLSTYLRCTVAALLAGVLAWAAAAATHLLAGEGHRGALLALLVGGTVLLVVYVGGLRLLRVRELADLAGPLRRAMRI